MNNNLNEEIIEKLNYLSKYYNFKKDKFRSKAYQKAAAAIRRLKYEITIDNLKKLKKVRGIGKGTRNKIREFLLTNEIQKINEIEEEMKEFLTETEEQKTISEFTQIWGVGKVKAKQLWKSGFRSISDIRENPNLLNDLQKIGLKYYNDLLKKIPRKTITIFSYACRVVLAHEFGLKNFKFKVAGSYRRGKSSSGDIDCLITSKKFNLKDVVKVLQKWKLISDVLTMKKEKFMGIATCPGHKPSFHFRMDIEFLPEEEWGSGLLYFTGSTNFNVYMRVEAKKRGLTLNQKGLFDLETNEKIDLDTEEEIMNYLDMDYVTPQEREYY